MILTRPPTGRVSMASVEFSRRPGLLKFCLHDLVI